MLIDWFTMIAQILNFLILVVLLKHFLYQPILKAIDQRETRIHTQIQEAEEKKAAAQRERAIYEDKINVFEQTLEQHRQQVLEEIKSEQQQLIEEARKAVTAFRSGQREQIKLEYAKLGETIQRKVQQEVLAIARKVLEDLATVNLEASITSTFLQRLALEKGLKAQLASTPDSSSATAQIFSSFELSQTQCKAIEQGICQTISPELAITFETKPALIAGIEFVLNGQKLSWNVAEYLGELEKNLGAIWDG